MMALSVPVMILILTTLVVFSLLTYLLASRIRAYIEFAIIFSLGVFLSLVIGSTIDSSATLGSAILPVIVSVILMLILLVRFNHHIGSPYKELNANSDRILNENDLQISFELGLGGIGDLEKIKNDQEKVVETFSTILSNINNYQKNISLLMKNLGEEADEMTNEFTDVSSDISQLMKSTTTLDEILDNIHDDTFKLLNKVESEFDLLAEYSRASDRIADQTNLIAVNAAIEASQTQSEDGNFSTVAEGIQRLSSRSRENSEKLHKSILATKRTLVNSIKKLANQLEELDSDVKKLNEISNRSSTFNHRQQSHLTEFELISKEGRELSQQIDEVISKYKY